jgi:DNA-binding HxlR family transcriptional regulator
MARQQLYPQEVLTDSSRLAVLLGDAWSIRIIASLSSERQRFSVLQRNLGISSKTLSSRLKELERQAIVARTLYAQVPLRVEYELTEKGYELKGLLDEFSKWDKKWE